MGDDAALLRLTLEDNLVSKYNCAMDLAMKSLYLQQFGKLKVSETHKKYTICSRTPYTFYG